MNVPATGGWQTWVTAIATVTLPAGPQTLTVDQDNGGWNLNLLAFGRNGSGSGSPAAKPLRRDRGGGARHCPAGALRHRRAGRRLRRHRGQRLRQRLRSDGFDLEAPADTGGG